MTVSIIMVRLKCDLEQRYAGMFDSDAPDFQRLYDEAMNDEELHIIRLEHEGNLPPVTWAEVTLAKV